MASRVELALRPTLAAMTLLGGAQFCCGAIAQSEALLCAKPQLEDLRVVQVQCDLEGRRATFSLAGPDPTSPYAGPLDRRRVTVIREEGVGSPSKPGAGISTPGASPQPEVFSAPALEDQIVKREKLDTGAARRGWKIATERVIYGMEGGGNGFVLDCSTARHLKGAYTLTVMECYSLEEQSRFVRALEAIE